MFRSSVRLNVSREKVFMNSIELIKDPKYYTENFLKIKGKTPGLIPFVLNVTQRDIYNTLRHNNRIILLKARQLGSSTCIAAWIYHKTITTPGTNSAIIGYNSDLTAELLDKVKMFYQTTPPSMRPTIQYNSKFEISFPKINSKIIVLPSTENVGRGYTLHNVLATELALWQGADEKMLALEQSVPIDGKIIIESCVTGDTYVTTGSGLLQMKDIAPWEDMPFGSSLSKEISLDTHKGQVTTSMYYRSGKQKGFRIKTQSGNSIGMSSVHPLLVNREGELSMIKSSDMVIGDHIATKVGSNMWGNYDPTSDFEPTEYKKNKGNMFLPKYMSEDLAYLIGVITGDGYVNKRYVIITTADDETRNFLFNNKLGLKFVETRIAGQTETGLATHFRCVNKSFVEFLVHCGIKLGVKAPQKEIPSAILRMNGIFVAQFLSGLFDTDGSASVRTNRKNSVRASLSSTSHKLLDVTRLLLLNFGVVSYVNNGRRILPTKRVKSESFGYNLDIATPSLPSFFSKVGFRLSRKQKHALALSESRGFLIPGLRLWCKKRYSYSKWGIRGIAKKLKLGMGGRGKRDDGMHYPLLDRAIELIPDDTTNEDLLYLKSIYDANYFYDEVVSIVPIEEEVYDFTVPDAHTFIANGFVSSNTPYGQGNCYHRMWMSDNGYTKKEYGWWWLYTEEEIEMIRTRINDPQKFAQEYGLEFLASGRPVFSPQSIRDQRENQLNVGDECVAGDKMQKVQNMFLKHSPEPLRIYRPPEPDGLYSIGADVAEGVTGGDYSVAIVLDRKTGEEVAMYRAHVAPDKFGEVLNEIGRLYNNGLMVVEVNNHGLTTITILKQLLYPTMYFRPSKMEGVASQWSDKLGWKTTRVTRPLLIDDFAQATRDKILILHSKELMDEMSVFVYNDNNDMVSQQGFHDDCVFAASIAYQGFKVLYAGSLDQLDYTSHIGNGY